MQFVGPFRLLDREKLGVPKLHRNRLQFRIDCRTDGPGYFATVDPAVVGTRQKGPSISTSGRPGCPGLSP